MSKGHSTRDSFGYAINGIKLALRNEPNIRVHFAVAVLVVILGIFFKISPLEFALLALTVGVVITLELVNTSLEALVDLVMPTLHEKAKIAKDVCAAGVLFSALTAFVVGLLIFLPKILEVL